MHIGVLTVILEIPESDSLKDKRQILRSLLETMRNKFNVSAAEIGENDTWRRAEIGIACIGNSESLVNTILNKTIEHIERNPRVGILGTEMEML